MFDDAVMSHYADSPWSSPTFSDLADFESKPSINANDFDTPPVLFKKHNTGHAGPRDVHADFSKGRQASDPRVIRHPKFWDTTGNVMLQMGSTLFRLHGSTLARHSPFFEDILREKPSQDILVDGALLHCLVLDKTTVKEVEVLLDAMENAVYVTEHARCHMSLILHFTSGHTTSNHRRSNISRLYYVYLPFSTFLNSASMLYTAWMRRGLVILPISPSGQNGMNTRLRLSLWHETLMFLQY